MPNPQHTLGPPSDSVDLPQVWAALRRGSRFIAAVAAALLALVVLQTLFSTMDFRSRARLYLGEIEAQPRTAGAEQSAVELASSGASEVASEIEIIRSRSLVERAILASGLNVSVSPANQGALRYWRWRWQRRDPALVDAGPSELRAANASYSGRPGQPLRCRARFVTRDTYELWSGRTLLGRGKLGESFKSRSLGLTLSAGRERGPRAGNEYELSVRSLPDATDRALKVLVVSAPRRSAGGEAVNVVTLEFVDESPYLAASFLEQLMLAYLSERQAWKTENAGAAESFVGKQLDGVRASLDELEGKLADYRSKNRVVVLDNEAKAMIEQIAKYEEQRLAARLQVAALSDMQRALQSPNPPLGAFLLGEVEDSVLEGMASSLTEARQKLTDLETRFNGQAPEVKQQRAQVAAQLDTVRNYVNSRLLRAQASLSTLNGMIGQFEQRLSTVPGAERKLQQLARESDVYGRTYSYLLERQQQAAIIKASTLSKNRVLDRPEVPMREDSPRLPLRLASGFLGLLLGAGLVLGKAFFSSRIETESDLRRLSLTAPIFATLPAQPKAGRGAPSEAAERAAARSLEAFRTLRANLYEWEDGRAAKVILVSSPESGGGATSSVRGLATALAADGKSVLVVDANLRKPNARRRDELGLAQVLSGERSWRELVRKASGAPSEFQRLSSGGAAAPELLTSKRLQAFFADVRDSFDYVLVDTPSFPEVADALVLCRVADAVLTVLRPQHTPKKAALEHVARLARAARALALVINDAGPLPKPRAARTREKTGRAVAAVKLPPTPTTLPVAPITPSETIAVTAGRPRSRLTIVGGA